MKREKERKGGKAAAPKRRGKRVENKENTRRAILRAALDLFAEKGFYRTTTKAISKKAGIAEGTLFNYFETKEDLAIYFFEESLTELIEWYQGDRGMKRAALPEKLFGIIQHLLDSDVTMAFDECTRYPASEQEVAESMRRSMRWARRCRAARRRPELCQFGIVQGGVYAERRFFVGPLPHSRLGHVVIMVIEGEPCDGAPDTAAAFATALRTSLRPALTSYEIPRQIFFVSQLLETLTGKIDRGANIKRLVAQHSGLPS